MAFSKRGQISLVCGCLILLLRVIRVDALIDFPSGYDDGVYWGSM